MDLAFEQKELEYKQRRAFGGLVHRGMLQRALDLEGGGWTREDHWHYCSAY